MELFKDEIIQKYIDWKKANPITFDWRSYVNVNADIQTALGFAKFFYPEVIELEGCIFLKDYFNVESYNNWKKVCGNDKKILEQTINSCEIRDFFTINTDFDDENIDEQIEALGNVLKIFWTLSLKNRFPDKDMRVDLYDMCGSLAICVFENV